MSVSFKSAHKDLPNAVSFLRAVLAVFIPFFLMRPEPALHWTAFGIFILGAVTDFLDGLLARSLSLESSLGKIIDPTADKILILLPLATFAALDLFPVWWIVPIFIREIVVTFCRIAWSLEGCVVGAEKVGKLKFGFQVAAVLAAFLYYFSFSQFWLAPFRLLLNYLVIATMLVAIFFTLYSGVSFFLNNRKNLQSPFFAKFCAAAGVGLFPVAPGTWGSLIGLAVVFLCQLDPVFYVVIFLCFIWLGFWSAGKLDLNKDPDPGYVVLDEVCGMMVSLFLIPLNPASALAGFFLFRFFDIWKPFPLRRLERLPRFWGILADDLGAGLYVWCILYFVFKLHG